MFIKEPFFPKSSFAWCILTKSKIVNNIFFGGGEVKLVVSLSAVWQVGKIQFSRDQFSGATSLPPGIRLCSNGPPMFWKFVWQHNEAFLYHVIDGG
jgi:hypothetical protein